MINVVVLLAVTFLSVPQILAHELHLPATTRQTEAEAAAEARQLVGSQVHAEVHSIMNSAKGDALMGFPFGSLEYMADCDRDGSVVFYLAAISTEGSNVASNSLQTSVQIRNLDWYKHPVGRGIMDTARVELFGETKAIATDEESRIEKCFFAIHPDAKTWKEQHLFSFFRLIPSAIYMVGGYGDEHYIGFIAPELYRRAMPMSSPNDELEKNLAL